MIKRKINYIYIGGIFLIPFCSLITHTLIPIPPTLLLWLISAIICLLFMAFRGKVSKINKLSIPSLIFSFYLLISQLIIGVDIRPLLGPCLAPLYFAVAIFYLDIIDNEKSKKLVTAFIYISVLIFLIEATWRILHPGIPSVFAQEDSSRWYYVFKSSGLMYVETNGLAIHIIVVMFFTFWWGEFIGKKFIIIKSLLLLVLFLSFSRAAIFSFCLGLIYFYFIRKMKNASFYVFSLLVAIILSAAFPIYILPFFQNDVSTHEKIGMFNEVLRYYFNADFLNIIFGVGNYNSLKLFSIYAHNYLLVYAIEMGFVGLLLLLLQFIYFIIISKKEILVMLIPFFIQVMSSTTIFIPHFYMTAAIILYFSRYKNTKFILEGIHTYP